MNKVKHELEEKDKKDIVKRTYKYALRIVQTAYKLPNSYGTYPIRDQLIRSGTSVGANAEEASAGFSRNDFIYKMAVASKEARESNYWLRLIRDSGIAKTKELEQEISDRRIERTEENPDVNRQNLKRKKFGMNLILNSKLKTDSQRVTQNS